MGDHCRKPMRTLNNSGTGKVITAVMLLMLFCSFSVLTLDGQDVTRPLSPQLDIVTVDPATGFAVLRWLPSSSPDVGSYVVYTYTGGTATAIDTVPSPYIYEYTHTASAARYRSVTYVVAAIDSSLNISPLSNSLSTIWISAADDICNGTVTVTWTAYENQFHPGNNYMLHISEGPAGSLPDVTLPISVTQYLLTGYDPETGYCFYVTATGGAGELSSSGRACVTTGSEAPPAWVMINAIQVEGDGLSISSSYDPATVMNDFSLFRFNIGTGSWDEVASSTGSAGRVSFSPVQADTTVVSLYRAAVVNSCGIAAAVSEPARNIVLESSITGTDINLRWNRPASGWRGLFSVWRDTGDGMREVAVSLSDTLWSDDYTVFASDVSAPEVVYRVTTEDPDAPAGIPPYLSSAAAIATSDNVFIPNAFTPGSSDENSIFRPEFSFIAGEYDFRIMSRNGALLFRSGDPAEGWDGRHNGRFMPPGVYLWSLRLATPSGETVVRTGTVTILP